MPTVKDLRLSAGDRLDVRAAGSTFPTVRDVVRVVDEDGARGGIVDTKPVAGRYSKTSGFVLGDEIIAVNGETVEEWLALLARTDADRLARPAQYRPIG